MKFWKDQFHPIAPAPLVFCCFALGVFLDHELRIPSTWSLLISLTTLLFLALPRGGNRILTISAVAILCLSMGSLRHHLGWWTAESNTMRQLAARGPLLVKLTGTIADSPTFIEPRDLPQLSPFPPLVRSRFQLDVTAVELGRAETYMLSGRVQASVSGHVLHAKAGDRVRIIGELSEPSPPRNPGEFDYARYLKLQGIHGSISANHPEAVCLLERRAPYSFHTLRDHIREKLLAGLRQSLSNETYPLASALLLGDRTALTPEVKDSFIQAGTMHLLAISGLHVGLIALLLQYPLRLLNFRHGPRTWATILFILLYALLVDARPAVWRATLMLITYLLFRLRGQRITLPSLLSLVGFLLLLFDPLILFDVGAQLSFHAVAGITWTLRQPWFDQPTLEERLQESPSRKTFLASLRFLKQAMLVSCAAMLTTAPLSMATFNLLAPFGPFVTLLSLPFIWAGLGCGLLVMLTTLLFPPATFPFAHLLQWMLTTLDQITNSTAAHFTITTVPWWWLWTAYGLIYLLFSSRPKSWAQRITGTLILLWAGVFPFAQQFVVRHQNEATVITFLSVGHGCAILIEPPGGETWLYDAGSLGSGSTTARTIQHALWQRNKTRIDGLFLSHADVDHFNAVPQLAQHISIKQVFTTPSFVHNESASTSYLFDFLDENSIPLKLIQQGDRLSIGTETETVIEVLHPSNEAHTWSQSDNANSLVLRITHGDSTLLLTGDLERDGLQQVIALPPTETDVLMVPHHGSVRTNTPEFAQWAKPNHLIVTSRDPSTEYLETRNLYREALGNPQLEINSTGDAAIEVILDSNEITIIPYSQN